MGIYTLSWIMILIHRERAPDCLKVKHEEICVSGHVVNQIYLKLFL
jgi:hypothetical protein